MPGTSRSRAIAGPEVPWRTLARWFVRLVLLGAGGLLSWLLLGGVAQAHDEPLASNLPWYMHAATGETGTIVPDVGRITSDTSADKAGSREADTGGSDETGTDARNEAGTVRPTLPELPVLRQPLPTVPIEFVDPGTAKRTLERLVKRTPPKQQVPNRPAAPQPTLPDEPVTAEPPVERPAGDVVAPKAAGPASDEVVRDVAAEHDRPYPTRDLPDPAPVAPSSASSLSAPGGHHQAGLIPDSPVTAPVLVGSGHPWWFVDRVAATASEPDVSPD